LLGSVATFLIRRNANFLVGRSIPEDRLKQIMDVLEQDIMVRSIHDVKATELGADTVRFKAEINFDGREITRRHLSRKETAQLLKEVRDIQTPEELERFLMDHGEQIIDTLGQEVDRIERNIKNKNPEVRHVDLEIL
ncbi:Zinc transporter 9, partial [Paramuricea clavata]